MDYQHVDHSSIPPFYDMGSRILILGSFPSIGSRKVRFYYGYPTNRFFKILAALFQEKEPLEIKARKAFLKRHRIALFDVIQECDIQGSSDSSIRNVVPNDLKPILETAPIQAIFTTGGLAHFLYEKYIGKESIPLPSPSAAAASLSLTKLVSSYSVILPYLQIE
jgi:double-stranded uracil-DNA glycosylase